MITYGVMVIFRPARICPHLIIVIREDGTGRCMSCQELVSEGDIRPGTRTCGCDRDVRVFGHEPGCKA